MTKSPHETFAPRKRPALSLIRLHPNMLVAATLFAFALIFWWAHVEHTQAEEKVIKGSNADMYVYHLPMREFGFERLRDGDMPLWNPYMHGGMPFFATYQAALFYPLNFPHWFLPGHVALSLIYLLHIFLAGLFMYLWMRELCAEPVAAAFAGVAYMLCAFVTYQPVWCHIVLGHTWIPLVFLLIHRTFERGRWGDAALLGVAVSCQFLTGYMQGLIYTFYGAFAYVAFLTFVKAREGDKGFERIRRPLGMTLIGLVVLPALLTAFQWMPTYLLSRLSVRPPGGLTREAILISGAVHPVTFLKALTDPSSHGWSSYSIYCGMLTLLFAAFALIHWERRRQLIFFSALGLISALVAFGGHTPLFDIYRHMPTGDWFRLPERLQVLTAFSIATLAGFGCSHLVRDVMGASEAGRWENARYAVFIGLCAVLILALPKAGGIYVFLFLVACLIGVRPQSASLVGIFAVLLVGLDLTMYVSNTVTYPWITREVFPELKEEKEFLREHVGLDRVHIFRAKRSWNNFLLNANFGTIEGIRETSGYESLTLQRYAEFCAYVENEGEPSYTIPFVGWRNWESGNAHPRMLNLLGARYIVEDVGRDLYEENAPPKKMPSSFKRKKVFSGTVDIYENPDALARAFFTSEVEVIGQKRGVLDRLASTSFDYRNKIILEEEPEPRHMPSGASGKGVSAEVIVEPRDEGKIDIIATVPSAGFIFLNDIFVPGWRALVDGAETKIYRADYLFMAIPVDAGEHSIEVEYRPAGFRAGVWVSLLSAAAIALGIAFNAARTRTRQLAPWERIMGSGLEL